MLTSKHKLSASPGGVLYEASPGTEKKGKRGPQKEEGAGTSHPSSIWVGTY